MEQEVFGIDLGTTYSCIAEISQIDKQPVIIKNDEEVNTTPSVVFFGRHRDILVGGKAKRSIYNNPTNAVMFIKREMGNSKWSKYLNGKYYTPVDISSMILKKLVDDANTSRKYKDKAPIKDAVITIPAYFGNTERQKTREAGIKAGLNVIAMIQEPTAAALSYGTKQLEGKTFMIYDLGGGTFDVNIMKLKNGELNTLATDGDGKLGGYDWDVALTDYVLQKCRLNTFYDEIKDTENGEIILRAERCKKILSKQDKTDFSFDFNHLPYSLDISREEFEDITKHLLERTIDIVRNAMYMRTDKSPISEIILVGGSSYMPMVKKRLQKEFPNSTIRLDQYEPDLAVAKGAAIHAYNLLNPDLAKNTGVKLGCDMASRSYGVGTTKDNGRIDIIRNLIKRTDPITYEGVVRLRTLYEKQTHVHISIYENTSTEQDIAISEGKLIAAQDVSWGTPVASGTSVNIFVKRGEDGIVHIEVECCQKHIYFDINPDDTELTESNSLKSKFDYSKFDF